MYIFNQTRSINNNLTKLFNVMQHNCRLSIKYITRVVWLYSVQYIYFGRVWGTGCEPDTEHVL